MDDVEIGRGSPPGAFGRVVELHSTYYHAYSGIWRVPRSQAGTRTCDVHLIPTGCRREQLADKLVRSSQSTRAAARITRLRVFLGRVELSTTILTHDDHPSMACSTKTFWVRPLGSWRSSICPYPKSMRSRTSFSASDARRTPATR